MNIVIVGAGNVATHLAGALRASGNTITQVYSRTDESAMTLASAVGAAPTTMLRDLVKDADLYLYSVKDDVLESVVTALSECKGVHAHTAGSLSISIFEGKQSSYGVFYPLQTFSKAKSLDVRQVPLFIEGNTPETEEFLTKLANQISDKVYPLTSEARKHIHLSAVFACNFTNYLYSIASDLLQEINVPFDVLLPLIHESVSKLDVLTPRDAQTGPAKRQDKQIMDEHIKALTSHESWQSLYEQISQLIIEQNNK